MSVAIWKFELRPGLSEIDMPGHAWPLSIGWQNDTLCMWAVVVPSNKSVKRNIYVAMTGQSCENELRGPFLGTAQHAGGLVAHAFDHGEATP